MERLLTTKEVSEITAISVSALEQWRLKGIGPRFVKIGRMARYKLSDIQNYLDNMDTFSSTTEFDVFGGKK
jgi:predicted DNA-binding transcriptional regulator AlpA